MFKKVILLAAAIATSSFATWDYFGLLQNNSASSFSVPIVLHFEEHGVLWNYLLWVLYVCFRTYQNPFGVRLKIPS